MQPEIPRITTNSSPPIPEPREAETEYDRNIRAGLADLAKIEDDIVPFVVDDFGRLFSGSPTLGHPWLLFEHRLDFDQCLIGTVFRHDKVPDIISLYTPYARPGSIDSDNLRAKVTKFCRGLISCGKSEDTGVQISSPAYNLKGLAFIKAPDLFPEFSDEIDKKTSAVSRTLAEFAALCGKTN
ncbi:MAG: hypothetical protein V1875_10495 [Candidatus Altiarchaeota archaeon]